MSDINPIIKQEPVDEDEPMVFDSAPYPSDLPPDDEDEPLFVEAEAVLDRATDNEGRPYPTVCFEKSHLNHPHHHRLMCGHDIMTNKIEKCGSNCATSKRDKKASGVPFECPDTACKRLAKVFSAKRGAAKPRKCILSHVYGRDAGADQKRVAEKSSGKSLRNGRVSQAGRKESQSPPPACTTDTGKKCTKRQKSAPVDQGELLNRELENDPSLENIMAFSGPGVRKKVGKRFMTAAEIADEVEAAKMTRDLRQSHVNTREEQRTRAKKAAKMDADFPPPPDKNTDVYAEAETEPKPQFDRSCDDCKRKIEGARYHCFDCPDFDFCKTCYEKKGDKHPMHHRFKVLDKPLADREDGSTPKVGFCVCSTTSTAFLVLCDGCQAHFHPGCIGAGLYQKDEYDIGTPFRDACLQKDHMGWKSGQIFHCESCQISLAAAKVDTARKTRAEKREKRRENEEAQGPSAFKMATSKKRAASELTDETEDPKEKDETSAETKRMRFQLPIRTHPNPQVLNENQEQQQQEEEGRIEMVDQDLPEPVLGPTLSMGRYAMR